MLSIQKLSKIAIVYKFFSSNCPNALNLKNIETNYPDAFNSKKYQKLAKQIFIF